ncbi:MAG: PQQ-dependent sugar dehydrogenase [Mucilaginibacter polytrichastri]|nr:PQQ-dependent sugar dehydrogenase [Mucilaginibacter polytrichastri]
MITRVFQPRKWRATLAAFGLLMLVSPLFFGASLRQEQKKAVSFKVDTLARNLTVPWEILFVPDGTMLFTERSGQVRIYRDRKLLDEPALSLDTRQQKKMGMLGLAIHPDFAQNHFVYMAYNYTTKTGNARMRVLRYRFSGDKMTEPKVLIEDIHANENHTGCRLVFGPDKKLYITTGDADEPALAQDLKALNGKILRVNDDGSIPADNPFVNSDTARKEIWTYGHRNPQGLAFEPITGHLYDSEHGPTGGDEINRIVKGKNYGWPVIHHGDTRSGMVSPLAEFTPSVGPSKLIFYRGNRYPGLKGSLLMATLRGESIIRAELKNGEVIVRDTLLKNQYGRIRALTEGPDGYLYFSTSQVDPPEGKGRPDYDMILRLEPAAGQIYAAPENTGRKQLPVKPKMADRSAAAMFQQLCASCHGDHLQGSDKVKTMLDGQWKHGSSKAALVSTITNGVPDKGMPAWKGAIAPKDISAISDYILSATKK